MKAKTEPEVIILSQDDGFIAELSRGLAQRKHRLLANRENKPDTSKIIEGKYEAAVVDLRPRLEEALTLIRQLRAARPEFPVIAFDMVEAGAPAIIEVDGGGASHCLSGPCDFAEMARKIIQSILNARPRAPVPSHFTPTHNPHSSLDCPVMIKPSARG